MFNSHPINQQLAMESFRHTLWQARINAFFSKLTRKPSYLKSYATANAENTYQKRYLGVLEIPTDEISGTVGRHHDFDGRFRPLKNHLRDRWVSIAVLARYEGWPPIDVFKVGDDYFVLDGHHRTSYARNEGIAFIDANVWEIVTTPAPPQDMQVIDVQQELFATHNLADDIIVCESVVCCCA